MKDNVFLSICLQNFKSRGSDNTILVGALPFDVKSNVVLMHGNELNQDLIRILVAEEKQIVHLAEIHKIPENP